MSFEAAITQAGRAVEAGSYDLARVDLEALAPEVAARGDERSKAKLARLLATVYVAMDLPDRACRAFVSGPEQRLDPVQVSPKIRRTLAACPGS